MEENLSIKEKYYCSEDRYYFKQTNKLKKKIDKLQNKINRLKGELNLLESSHFNWRRCDPMDTLDYLIFAEQKNTKNKKLRIKKWKEDFNNSDDLWSEYVELLNEGE